MAAVYDINYTVKRLVLTSKQNRLEVSYSPSDGATIAVASILLKDLDCLRPRHDMIRGFTHTW